jgi:hypothetical protein
MTHEELHKEIYDYVHEYNMTFSKGVALGILNRRFNKQTKLYCKKSVKQFLAGDEWFITRLNENGSVSVFASSPAVSRVEAQERARRINGD